MGKKILIIEDEKSLVQLLTPMLMAEGYDIMAAYDGEEGLTCARKEKPDLIILDIMLPKMNGYEICRLLKFDLEFEKIPIILLTAKASDQDKEIVKDIHADAYIIKPYEPKALLDKIKELLK